MVLTLAGLLFPGQCGRLQVRPAASARGGVGLAQPASYRGGSVRHSDEQHIQEPRQQFTLSRLGENLGPLNHQSSRSRADRESSCSETGDSARSQQLAVQTLDGLASSRPRRWPSSTLLVCAVLSAGLVLLVLLMKRSVAEKGEHVSAH